MHISSTLEAEGRALAARLGGRWSATGGLCRCPAHDDRSPSLSVRVGQARLLFHCFAGCPTPAVMAALVAGGHLRPGRSEKGRYEVSVVHARGDPPDYAVRLWRDARSIEGTAAERYLAERSLAYRGAALRFHPRTPFGRWPVTVFAPALLAVVEDETGIVALHRTRLDPPVAGDPPTPRKAALGPLGSGAVRLSPCAKQLGLAEGIESALAVTLSTGLACWAALGALRFGRIALPPEVRELVLFPDNDEAGRAAEDRARAAFRMRLAIRAHYPPGAGSDWNDALLAGHRPAR